MIRVVFDVLIPVVHDRGDALPEALLRIHTNPLQMRLHEIDHRVEMTEERALPGLDVFDRAAPLRRQARGVPALAPDADDESGGAVLEQCHGAPGRCRCDARLCAAVITAPSRRHHRNITSEPMGV